jgi:hypothetical protein
MVSFLDQGSWLRVNAASLPGTFPIIRTISAVSVSVVLLSSGSFGVADSPFTKVLIGIAFLLPLILWLILDLTLWCWRIFWNRQPVEEDTVETSGPKGSSSPEASAANTSHSSQTSHANPRRRKGATKDNDAQ